MPELYERLKDSAAKVAADLALVIRGQPANTKAMKLAAVRITLDESPIVLIAYPTLPEGTTPFHTGGYQDVTYALQVVAAVRSDRAIIAGTPDILEARGQLRRAFQRPTAMQAAISGDTLSELLLTRVQMGAPISREKWLKGWDATAITVFCRCVEAAS